MFHFLVNNILSRNREIRNQTAENPVGIRFSLEQEEVNGLARAKFREPKVTHRP